MATQDASDALADQLLNTLAAVYIGLSSSPPTKQGTNITVPPVADYVRASPAFAAAASRKRGTTTIANFVNGGGNAATTPTPNTFGYATFHSALTGGTFYASTQLSQAVAWTAGQPVTMAAGDISLEFEVS